MTTTTSDCPQLLRLAAAHLNTAARHTKANACGDLTSPWHSLAGQIRLIAGGIAPIYQDDEPLEPRPVGVQDHLDAALRALDSIPPGSARHQPDHQQPRPLASPGRPSVCLLRCRRVVRDIQHLPDPCCGPVCCSRPRTDSPRQSGGSMSEPPANTSRFPKRAVRVCEHRSIGRHTLRPRCSGARPRLKPNNPTHDGGDRCSPKPDRPRTLKRDLPGC